MTHRFLNLNPTEGRMHVARMCLNCMMTWKCLLSTQPEERCVLYGDPAYPLRVDLQALFRIGILTRDMEIFNESMSAVRSSVELLFADVINYFKFFDFKKNLKIGLSQVGKMYIVPIIFHDVQPYAFRFCSVTIIFFSNFFAEPAS